MGKKYLKELIHWANSCKNGHKQYELKSHNTKN